MENDFSYQDDYVKRRIYQLKNHEEIYKKYSHSFDIERELACTELILFELINQILKEGEYQNDSHLMAIDIIAGQIDEVACELLSRHEGATKELDYIADLIHEEE